MTEIDEIREQALDNFYGRNGTTISYETAYRLFLKIPVDPWSQYAIGFMLENALYLNEDKRKAIDLYTKSAEQGNSEAQYMVGLRVRMEMGGIPVEKCEYFNRSAEQGNPNALCALGTKYILISQDAKKALEYLSRSAELGNGEAYYRMALLYSSESLSKEMGCEPDKGKSEECYAKAFEIFMEYAKKGDALMQYRVGEMYYYGNHVPEDKRKAAEWFELSARYYGNAYLMLAIMYENGDGAENDPKKAFDYCSKAAEKGIGEALYHLSRMYEGGIGTQKDAESAKVFYERAIKAGYEPKKSYVHVP